MEMLNHSQVENLISQANEDSQKLRGMPNQQHTEDAAMEQLQNDMEISTQEI